MESKLSKREHTIVVCLPNERRSDHFQEIAMESKTTFDKKYLVAKLPPPERNILLSIWLSDLDRITAASLKEVFGFAFDTEFLIEGSAVRMSSNLLLKGLLSRVANHNRRVKYYGIKVIAYTEGLSEDLRASLYFHLSDMCKQLSSEIQADITFEIARDQIQLNYILENELLRMMNGDTRVQFAYDDRT